MAAAKELAVRLVKLEADHVAAVARVGTLKATLGTDYAEGREPASTLKALATARDEVAGLESALIALDQHLFQARTSEWESATAKNRAEVEKVYREFETEFKAVVSGKLAPLAARAGLPEDFATGFVESSLADAWTSFSDRLGASRVALGARPTPPMKRVFSGEL